MKKYILISIVFIFLFNLSNAQIDTAGYKLWKPLFNSMSTWDDGAFNMSQTGHPDYGWGIYNNITHGLSGDKIFLIKLQNGTFKQILIEEKNSVSNIYSFRYADITGENQIIETARCVDHTDNLFLYYSLQNQTFVERDAVKTAWDIVLTRFTDTTINYNVTGFLLNESSMASVYHAPDSITAENSTLNDTTEFKPEISTIGNSWYKLSGMSIVPLDTMVYFVKTDANDIYKMQVNYFQSGASGKGRVGVKVQKLHPETGSAVYDTLEMGSGYANDVYFSMNNGIILQSPRASWDIAFKTQTYSASVITNSTMGISLYTYPKAGVEAWTSLDVRNGVIENASVYPNPANDEVSFISNAWKDNSEIQLTFYNSTGQMILNLSQKVNGNSVRIDISNLSDGLYHVRIINNGQLSVGKVIVSR